MSTGGRSNKSLSESDSLEKLYLLVASVALLLVDCLCKTGGSLPVDSAALGQSVFWGRSVGGRSEWALLVDCCLEAGGSIPDKAEVGRSVC